MKTQAFHVPSQFLIRPIFILFLIFTSCEDMIPSEDAIQSTKLKAEISLEKSNDFYGPTQPMGNGVIRSVVTVGHDGVPKAVGIEFSAKALEKLPDEEHNIHLALSNKAEGLIVDHIDVGWNPHGHEPEGVYTLPHFDVHFYWISVAEVDMIPFSVGMADLPPAQYRPVDYSPDAVTIPQMGRHWLYNYAPELPWVEGATFTQTFIYGSYDSEFHFYEPMVTKSFLEAKDFNNPYPISQPTNFQRSGYYADSYEFNYDSVKKQYRVMLTGLHWENGDEDL